MTGHQRLWLRLWLGLFLIPPALLCSTRSEGADLGVVPVGPEGRPLNLDFEAGSLKDWKAEGDAFTGPPIQGDAVARDVPT